MATDMGGFAVAGIPLELRQGMHFMRSDLSSVAGANQITLKSVPFEDTLRIELTHSGSTRLLVLGTDYTVAGCIVTTTSSMVSGDIYAVSFWSRFSAGGGGGGSIVPYVSIDPYFSNVVALLHMDGSNGGTTFTDQKGATWTSAGVTTSTSSPKFGTASAALVAARGDYLKTPHTTSWDWGANDFSIEAWVRQTTSDINYHGIFVCDDTSAARGLLLFLDQTTGYLRFSAFTGSTSHPVSDSVALTLNTWYHVAAVRDGSNLRLYKNGVQVNSAAISGALNTVTHPAVIGTLWDSGAQNTSTTFNGNIDDVRITNGVCRYPGGTTFSVPTAAFPDS